MLTDQPSEPMVTVRLPRSHWKQIVRDIEDLCGIDMDSGEIEILSQVEVEEDDVDR